MNRTAGTLTRAAWLSSFSLRACAQLKRSCFLFRFRRQPPLPFSSVTAVGGKGNRGRPDQHLGQDASAQQSGSMSSCRYLAGNRSYMPVTSSMLLSMASLAWTTIKTYEAAPWSSRAF